MEKGKYVLVCPLFNYSLHHYLSAIPPQEDLGTSACLLIDSVSVIGQVFTALNFLWGNKSLALHTRQVYCHHMVARSLLMCLVLGDL